MNKKDALEKLKKKEKYIDDDVFKILVERVEKTIQEEIEEENEKFIQKATFIMKQEGISAESLKNFILNEFYDKTVLKNLISDF